MNDKEEAKSIKIFFKRLEQFTKKQGKRGKEPYQRLLTRLLQIDDKANHVKVVLHYQP